MMKTKSKKISDSRIELTVTLEAKDLAPVKAKAVEKLAKELKVEGFRKGKVPTEIALKFIPANDLNAEVVDQAVRTTVIPAFQEVEKQPLALPNVNVTKFVPDETVEYTATADIVPEVKLGDYKKLGVKTEMPKVTDKDIEEVLNNLATSFAEKKAVKRAAALGDEVVIDFVGKRDGEPFSGGSAKNHALLLGSGAFIPGFEEGIVGHEPGDKFDLNLTFPKDYGIKDLAGAKVVFETLLKQVNEMKKPAIDDDLAKKCGPFKDLTALKEDIQKNLTAQNEARYNDKLKDDLVNALVAKSKVPAPEILIDDQMRMVRADAERNAAGAGVSFDEYLKMAGTNLEDWEKEARKVAEARVKASLALQNLALAEKITVSDDEVAAKIAELREIYKKAPDAVKSLKDPNVRMDIRNRMMIEKTLDYLVSVNK